MHTLLGELINANFDKSFQLWITFRLQATIIPGWQEHAYDKG
jgi:hypothetical protein